MKDFAYFCPACGSPSVEASSLAGGDATCDVCSWGGRREELVALPLEHHFQSQDEMLTTFIKQLANVMAKAAALPIGRVLLQWGFLSNNPKEMTEDLKHYIRSMVVHAAGAVISTRQHLERAKANAAKKAEEDRRHVN
jgi:hypothetical protein